MKTIVMSIYRVIYCSLLGVLFVGLLRRLPIGESLRSFEIPLYYAFIASVALSFLYGVAFEKRPEWQSWAVTAFLCAMFIWYTWFSLSAPFVLHELHTVDPAEAVREISRYQIKSEIATALAIIWFMSLPTILHWKRRRRK